MSNLHSEENKIFMEIFKNINNKNRIKTIHMNPFSQEANACAIYDNK